MGSLYIDRQDLEIKVEGNSLVFYLNANREGSAPIQPLERVIIIGKLCLETSVLHKLCVNNVSVIFLSGRRLAFRGMLHGRLHRNGLLRLKQYEKSLGPFCLVFARELVEAKLSRQISLLSELKDLRPDFKYEISNSIKSIEAIREEVIRLDNIDSIRGFEGSAANSYFKALSLVFPPSLNFKNRIRRPPTDPVNSLLSLSYTLLHYELVREVEVIGLDPTIGFYHSFDYGRESLACDLVEPFRPDVDRFVFDLIHEKILRESNFAYIETDGQPGCYLKKASRKKFFEKYEEWARDNRPIWKERVQILARRILNG
ncbi:MAG: CRISPR-associated endonuclease Cas1 [Candidatus Aminicenantes bacterium]|nr:CRISPR-associated endonuclease Cas1 [Candidatus Aminicenantes bacterium]